VGEQSEVGGVPQGIRRHCGKRERGGTRTCAAAEDGVERSAVRGHGDRARGLGFGEGVHGEPTFVPVWRVLKWVQ
jgi:hypothetical protein